MTEQDLFIPAETIPGVYQLIIDCDPAGGDLKGLPEITVLPADEGSQKYTPDTPTGRSPNLFCPDIDTWPSGCLVNDQIPFL